MAVKAPQKTQAPGPYITTTIKSCQGRLSYPTNPCPRIFSHYLDFLKGRHLPNHGKPPKNVRRTSWKKVWKLHRPKTTTRASVPTTTGIATKAHNLNVSPNVVTSSVMENRDAMKLRGTNTVARIVSLDRY